MASGFCPAIDHIVLLVRDLERAAERLSELGFTVCRRADRAEKPGSTFRFVSFVDGSYILLNAFSEKAIAEHRLGPLLSEREGWSDWSVVIGDLDEAVARASDSGIVIGGETAVRNILTTGEAWGLRLLLSGRGSAGDPALPFLVQDVEGRNARIPHSGTHDSGAVGIASVTIASAEPLASAERLSILLGLALPDGPEIRVGRQEVRFVSVDSQAAGSARIGGPIAVTLEGPSGPITLGDWPFQRHGLADGSAEEDILVEPDWLSSHLGDRNLVVLDCSWSIPEAGRDMMREFESGHIPGARFFDLNRVSDRLSLHPNMLPTADDFAAAAGAAGIGRQSEIVLYDSGYASARLWWMFRYFGHNKVRILNGGWKRWLAEGRPIEIGPVPPRTVAMFQVGKGPFTAATSADVLAALSNPAVQLLDARTPERFTGELASGYPGVPGGHVPGAVNIPWAQMLPQAGDFTFLPAERARTILAEAGVDLDRPMIVMCGSGVTAAVIGLQLTRLGRQWALYDGSWHEWAQLEGVPLVLGGATP